MKNTTLSRLALMLSLTVGLAITAKATPTLTMTEVSSTTLTYSWNGGALQTLTASTPDHWSFTISDAVVTGLGNPQTVNVYWKEPEWTANNPVFNYLQFLQYAVQGGTATTINVISDFSTTDPQMNYHVFDNGTTISFLNDLQSQSVSGGNNVQFTDNGDRVPDSGTTAALLGIGLISLGALRRKLNF